MNILVSGGAGFIGSHVVELLLENNHNVTVIDDFSTGKRENLPKNNNLIIVEQSITDNMDVVCEGIDVIIHLAANPAIQFTITNPVESTKINLFGTINLLDAAKKNNVKRFVFASSCSVYGEPTVPTSESNPIDILSPYAEQKYQSERWCDYYQKQCQLSTIALRFFNVYGPRQNPDSQYSGVITKWLTLIKQNKQPAIFGDGEQTRDFIHVKDIARAIYAAATTKETGVFNIGSGSSVTINKVIANILKMNNSSLEPLHKPAIKETRHSQANITKAKKLGWQPTITFEEGIKTLR